MVAVVPSNGYCLKKRDLFLFVTLAHAQILISILSLRNAVTISQVVEMKHESARHLQLQSYGYGLSEKMDTVPKRETGRMTRDPSMVAGNLSSSLLLDSQAHRHARVLFGIFSCDSRHSFVSRERYRWLFQLWNDDRVCELSVFRKLPRERQKNCQLVWTFVLGAGGKDTPTENVGNERPMLVEHPVVGKSPDWNATDFTLLNIRENMEEGKSQTWLKYAAEVADRTGLDYVVKCDEDSLLSLHEFFRFIDTQLAPAPLNKQVFAGALRHKNTWNRQYRSKREREQYENFFRSNHDNVHIYIAGKDSSCRDDFASLDGRRPSVDSPSLSFRFSPSRPILFDESKPSPFRCRRSPHKQVRIL
jgi:hypothetical protein